MVNPFPLHNLHLLEAAVPYHPEADLYTFQAFQTVYTCREEATSPLDSQEELCAVITACRVQSTTLLNLRGISATSAAC